MYRRYVGPQKKMQAWLASFEDNVIHIDAKHAGKIDWDTAIHFFNSGLLVEDAANRYVQNRATKGSK